MQQGWICLHRGLLDWEWYNDINVSRLFIHCLIRANHKPKKWRGINIDRGQFWTSVSTLTKETGLSASKIKTSISKLEMTGELASKGQAGGRMITVLKYNDYQDNSQQVSKPLASQSPALDQPLTTNNNDNNDNNENHDNNENKKKVDKEMNDAFNLFWFAGMKKSNKAKAEVAFKKLAGKNPMVFAEKLAGDVKARLSNQQMGFDKMMPTTYLNNARWEDELTTDKKYNPSSTKWAHIMQPEQSAERVINPIQDGFLITDQAGDFTL